MCVTRVLMTSKSQEADNMNAQQSRRFSLTGKVSSMRRTFHKLLTNVSELAQVMTTLKMGPPNEFYLHRT